MDKLVSVVAVQPGGGGGGGDWMGAFGGGWVRFGFADFHVLS